MYMHALHFLLSAAVATLGLACTVVVDFKETTGTSIVNVWLLCVLYVATYSICNIILLCYTVCTLHLRSVYL